MHNLNPRRIRHWLWTVLWMAMLPAEADDWPTYRHDMARSGVTKEALKPPLAEDWTFVPLHPPSPAWGDPQPKEVEGYLELPRVKFDDAFHVAAADGAVFFGSSSDHTVYCLNASSGKVKWTHVTDAPVRLAPTVSQDRVYVGSDDGCVYCLSARNGREIWKVRGAESEDVAIGHGKVVSLWPIRTGVLVDKDTAYFGAGIFPHEGLYLHAVRAKDGKSVWQNDDLDEMRSGSISPQGYLLASSSKLFVPSGRCPPAALDRKDGDLLYQGRVSWRTDGLFGGTYALLTEDMIYSGTEQIIAYAQDKGKTGFAWFHGRRLVVTPKVSYMSTDTELSALDRTAFPPASQKRQELMRKRAGLEQKQSELKRAIAAARRKGDKPAEESGEKSTKTKKKRKSRRSSKKSRRKGKKKSEEPKSELGKLEQEMEALQQELEDLAKAEDRALGAIAGSKKWRLECECPDSLILAGDILYAGGLDHVIAVNAESGKKLWTGKVDGRARGLAVSDGRLFVSTDKGKIHCFAEKSTAKGREQVSPPKESSPYPHDDLTSFYKSMAKLVAKTDAPKGAFCLVIGAGTGRLAYELAKQTDWMIYGIEESAQKVEKARKALSAAGLYGARVCVNQGSLTTLPYPNYFANVIVCETGLLSGKLPTPPKELLRVLKPHGGVAYVGQPDSAKGRGKALSATLVKKWLKGLGSTGIKITHKGDAWARIDRGGLEGEGTWTHQYAEPGNTACSDERLVKCPLGLLWFGEPGPTRMPSRHASAAAPLSINGRLFVQAEEVIMAYDAYNGVHLWDREIPGAQRLGMKTECSNLAAADDSLFVAVDDECLRLDQATGKTEKTYKMPSSGRRKWGYIACVDGTLFGSTMRSRLESDSFFALDVKTGKKRWVHPGKNMLHNSMCIGDGTVFLIESSISPEQRKSAKAPAGAVVRWLKALDAKTGKVLWHKFIDLTNCIKIGAGGGEVTVMYKDKMLFLCMAPWNGHFNEEYKAGKFSRRSVIALSSDDGEEVWSGHLGYRSRPLIVGDTLYAEPWAYDIKTGKPRKHGGGKWEMFRPGHHCGCMAAGQHILMFRSYTFAYYDLIKKDGIKNFGGHRPGCWINFLAAGGLVLVPEASSGCICPFPIHCTVVLYPKGKEGRKR